MITIVMPTFNKAPRIKIALEHFKFLKSHQYIELIVVNDGSTDDTKKVIDDCLEALPLHYFQRIKVINTENKGRANARNEGIAAAENDLVLFLDDDIIVDPNLVEEHILRHKKQSNLVVRGKIFELPYLKFFEDPSSRKMQNGGALTSALKTQIIKNYDDFDSLYNNYLFKNRKTSKFESDIESLYESTDETNSDDRWIGCIGANFSISKKSAEVTGFFDVNFGHTWGCEDLEFGYRLSKNGNNFSFNSLAICYHMSHFRKNYKNDHQKNMNYFLSKHCDYQLELLQKYFKEEISLIDWLNMKHRRRS